jgi:N-acetylglucosaminyl-diphospho-decaprenol L-rhamnosyltransferase
MTEAVAAANKGVSPVVSLIIVHYRSPELLACCLTKIAEANISIACEVIVVDNDPLDHRGAELADQHGVRYILNDRNVGYGRAANQGMAAARGRYQMILNPDVEVMAGSVERLAEYLDQNRSVAMVGPKLFSPDGSVQDSARTFYTFKIILLRRTFLGKLFPRSRELRRHLMQDWDHNDTREVDWMLGGALMARGDAVRDVGGMDDRFFLYFEDVDWCSRMARRGWRVVYVHDATMVHAHQRASAQGFLTPGKRMHIESALRFYEKWSAVLFLWKKKSTEIRAILTLLSDVALLSIAFFLAYYFRYLLGTWIPGWTAGKPMLGLGVYTRFIAFADLVAVGTFYLLDLYKGDVWRDRWREFFQLIKGAAITSMVVMASTFLFTTRPMSRFTVLLYFIFGLVLVTGGRALLRRFALGVRDRKLHLKRLAVFATEAKIAELKSRFSQHGTFGYEPVYFAHEEDDRRDRGESEDPIQRRIDLIEDERIAEAVVFESPEQGRMLDELVPRLMATGIPVVLVPRTDELFLEARRLGDFMGFGAVAFGGRSYSVASVIKNIGDRLLAFALLLLGLPLHLIQVVIAGRGNTITVPLTGRKGTQFALNIYRMYRGPAAGIPLFRIYPALVNVLKGDLSFVGLAPLTPQQWESTEEAYRFNPPDALPGLAAEGGGAAPYALGAITDSLPAEEMLKHRCALNRRYVKTWSLSQDLRILLETLSSRGDTEGENQ